ncbi:hypothetical protein D9O40_18285 [Clostridium autoethanogenum]|uniref:Uncharacterized protein n=1 Tax=Clostridium autoethanogenum TaxID=84023 RepID=A0A3M0SEF2_9CLOT|nr:hypothetical protein [Clostridium autoethanogenum]RMC93027.1 hypothetical protein D9O40_18285 [Clostridium autoethanogenum]
MDFNIIKTYFTIKQNGDNMCKAICPCHPDKEASLSISYDSNNCKTLLYCHAGCQTRDILDKVGLKFTDLFDRNTISVSGSFDRSFKIVATYKYKDETGKVLFEKVRFYPKKFLQKRKVNDAIVWGLEGGNYYENYPGSNVWSRKKKADKENVKVKRFEKQKPILYNLPDLIEGVKKGQNIYIVEGEKDVDNLKKIGIVATCNFDGASKSAQRPKWKKEYNKYFKGASVILLPDNDNSGRAHMENVAKNLYSIASSVKVLELGVEKEKSDVSDWLEEGHTSEELLKLVNDLKEHVVKNHEANKDNKYGFDENGKRVKEIFEYDNSYCFWYKDRDADNEEDLWKIKQISNFIIEPVEKIETETDNILKVNIQCQNGKKLERVFNVSLDLMSGYSSFKKALKDLLIFDGRDKELESIKKIILSKNFPIKKGITVTGFHKIEGKWIFAAGNKVINQDLKELDNIVLLTENDTIDSSILNLHPITKEELKEISKNLFKFNVLGKVSTILGLTAAMFLKEKLYSVDINFSHLLIIGQAGSGKSKTVEDIVVPILGIEKNLVGADRITKFTIEKATSSTSVFPYIIDEYKPTHMDERHLNMVSDLARNLYGCITVAKGNPALKTTLFKLRSPMILIGEGKEDETAVNERSLQVYFSKKESLQKIRTDAYFFLKANKELLRKFGRSLLNEALQIEPEKLKHMHQEYVEKLVDKRIQDDRVVNSVAVCMCGIALIKKVFENSNIDITTTGYSEYEILKSINETVLNDLLDTSIKTKTEVDKTIEIIDILADTGKLIENFDYKLMYKSGEVALQIKRIYEGMRVANIKDGILPQRDFTKQLNKTFDNSQYKAMMLLKNRELVDYCNQKCYVIKFSELEERGLELNKFVDDISEYDEAVNVINISKGN